MIGSNVRFNVHLPLQYVCACVRTCVCVCACVCVCVCVCRQPISCRRPWTLRSTWTQEVVRCLEGAPYKQRKVNAQEQVSANDISGFHIGDVDALRADVNSGPNVL